MARGSRAGLRLHGVAALSVLAFAALASPALAQLTPVAEGRVWVYMTPETGALDVPIPGRAEVQVQVFDATSARVIGQTPTPQLPQVFLQASVIGPNATGWTADVSPNALQTLPGRMHTVTLGVISAANVEHHTVTIRLNATWRYIDYSRSFTMDVVAHALNNAFVNLLPSSPPVTVRPHEFSMVSFEVTNGNLYPEMILFTVTAPNGYRVLPPPTVALAPGETREVFVPFKAPTTTLYSFGRSDVISLKAIAQSDPAAFRETGAVVVLRGGHMPEWMLLQVSFALFALAVGIVRERGRQAERIRERGAPEYPGLPPEEAAALLVLKGADAKRYRSRREQLRAMFLDRRREFRQTRSVRRGAARQQRGEDRARHAALLRARAAEASAEGRAKKAQARQQKMEEKRQKRAAARAAKLEKKAAARARKAEKALEKRRRREEKALAKNQARLDRAEAKKEARAAKAKARQVEALLRKKERLEKRADRDARRRRRKGGDGPDEGPEG